MSQCYHAELKESVTRIVKGADSISYPIELTEILPAEEMKDLLKEQLQEAGWCVQNEEETVFIIEGTAGEILTIDLDEMEMTAKIETEREVVSEVIAHASAESRKQAERSAARQLKEEMEVIGDQIEDAGTRDLQKEVTAQLAESESARQRGVNELLQRVYAESLKRKAGQLGDVMEITETTGEDGNYELTIRIEQ
ncbi:MAG: hypothetical protein P1V20_21020 [Verrucomicrobiales bacterium]|nr:hypothetical protein [Verrucomicrobiales bacterium]